MLAGLSVDYYIRLEQGRERHPSAQVVEALAAALRLDEDGRLHLHRLAGQSPRHGAPASSERVDPQLLQLLNAWQHQPALVLGLAYDVLAWNALGGALFDLADTSTNLLVRVFTEPAARSFYVDWRQAALNTVAGFRLAHGAAPGHPRVRQVLGEVTARSPEFADMWARHDVRGKSVEVKRFRHRQVGEMTLRMQTFDVRSSPGQQLVVYHADPGTESAQALSLLGSWAVTRASLD